MVAVLKAHNVDPRWRKGTFKDLSAECQQRFRSINLHWHDLRHEYASRLVERGVCWLAQVSDRLGHASIVTTERYDNLRLEALQQPLGGWKEARRSIRRSQARTNFQELFKIPPNRASPKAKTPRRNPLQVTDRRALGELACQPKLSVEKRDRRTMACQP